MLLVIVFCAVMDVRMLMVPAVLVPTVLLVDIWRMVWKEAKLPSIVMLLNGWKTRADEQIMQALDDDVSPNCRDIMGTFWAQWNEPDDEEQKTQLWSEPGNEEPFRVLLRERGKCYENL